MAQFPRKESDNSLDFDAFDLLSHADKKDALIDLKSESPEDFKTAMQHIRIQKEQNSEVMAQQEKQIKALQNEYTELENKKNEYLAAYKADMEKTITGSNNQSATPKTKNKKSSSCTLF